MNEVEAMDDGMSRIRFVGVVFDAPVTSDPVTVAQMTFHMKKLGYTFLIFQNSEFQPEKTEAICCGNPDAEVVKPRLSNVQIFVGDADAIPPVVTAAAPRPERMNPK